MKILEKDTPANFENVAELYNYEMKLFFRTAALLFPEELKIENENHLTKANRQQLYSFLDLIKNNGFEESKIQIVFQKMLNDRKPKVNILDEDLSFGNLTLEVRRATAPPNEWKPLNPFFEKNLCSNKQRKNMTWEDLERYMNNGATFPFSLLNEVGPQVFKDLWTIISQKYQFANYSDPKRKWTTEEWCQNTFDMLQKLKRNFPSFDETTFDSIIKDIIERREMHRIEKQNKGKKKDKKKEKEISEVKRIAQLKAEKLKESLKSSFTISSNPFEIEQFPVMMQMDTLNHGKQNFFTIEHDFYATKESPINMIIIFSNQIETDMDSLYQVVGRTNQNQWVMIGQPMTIFQLKEKELFITQELRFLYSPKGYLSSKIESLLDTYFLQME